MSRGLYISPFFQNFTRCIQEKNRTNDSNIGLSIVFFLSDHSELCMENLIFIWYQGDAKIILFAKICMRRFWILGNTNNLDPKSSEIRYEPREVIGLQSATWSIILGIEVEEGERGLCEESWEHSSMIREYHLVLFFRFLSVWREYWVLFDMIPELFYMTLVQREGNFQ